MVISGYGRLEISVIAQDKAQPSLKSAVDRC